MDQIFFHGQTLHVHAKKVKNTNIFTRAGVKGPKIFKRTDLRSKGPNILTLTDITLTGLRAKWTNCFYINYFTMYFHLIC